MRRGSPLHETHSCWKHITSRLSFNTHKWQNLHHLCYQADVTYITCGTWLNGCFFFFFRSICSVRSVPFSSSFFMRVTGMLSVLSPFHRGGYWGQIQLTLWAKAKLWLFWHWVCRVLWFYTLKHFIYPLFLSPTFFGIGVVLLKKSQEPKVLFFFLNPPPINYNLQNVIDWL